MRGNVSAIATLKSLFFAFCCFAWGGNMASAQDISTSNLMRHIQNLSASELSGRMAGTDGYMKAAKYVAEELQSYGVKPYDDDWQQLFEVECNQVENCTFNTYVNDNDERTVYVLGRDFVCGSMTGRGYADANVVFCGYGMDAASFNEYAGVDTRGKIVLVVSDIPDFLPSSITQRYATLRDKARVAKAHGAVALVVVNRAKNCRRNEVQGMNYCGEGPHMHTFPVLQPTMECGELLMEGEKASIEKTMALIDETMKPQSFHLLKKFEIDVNARYQPRALTANVVGFIKGWDKKMDQELIVVGANLDGLGMQGETCLFPGSDDNASGVAALLECARLFTSVDEYKPRRSVVFVVFSGSEIEHLGAQVFLSNFDKVKKIEAYIGAERLGNGDSIVAMGNGRFPALWEVAHHNDSTIGFLATGVKTMPKGDAAPFVQEGIPSLVFCTLNGNRYAHVPSDKPENINRELITKSATLMFLTIKELTDGDYRGRSKRR